MVDFSISDEERAMRSTVRTFVERELIPLESEIMRRGREGGSDVVTDDEMAELQAKAKKFDLWGLSTPEEYGGLALPAVTRSLVEMEFGRSFIWFRPGGETDNILFHCNPEQAEIYLKPAISGERKSCFAITEPGAGSDAANIRTSARRDGDDWIINGEKVFITGGNSSDFIICIAVTDSDKGTKGGFTAFLVDREMGYTTSPIETMGSACPATIVLDNVRVPGSNVLGEVGQGWELAMSWIGKGRYLIPSRAVGGAERLLSLALQQANDRSTFGKPIGTNQAIAWMIADSDVELEAARWLVLKAAWTVDNTASGSSASRHDSAIAKLYGTNMINRVVDRVMQIHGGMGYTREMPIEQWYRDVRLWRIFEGTDEMQRLIISRDLLRGYTKIGGQLA
jgi:acyl-CoA dehydrogenase